MTILVAGGKFMKKIFVFILGIILVTGCSCGNTKLSMETPTKKVENFFSNYQTLNDDVLKQLNEVVNRETDFTDDQKEEYKELMKNHYKNLKYEIKDETINGDHATVTVEIEVTDYSKIMTDADNYLSENPNEFNNEQGTYDISLFTKYRLEKLKEAKDTVKYTLDLTLTKINNEWILDNISDVDESKIHGMYIY
jgi:REP element-mobilizing transposase RayT